MKNAESGQGRFGATNKRTPIGACEFGLDGPNGAQVGGTTAGRQGGDVDSHRSGPTGSMTSGDAAIASTISAAVTPRCRQSHTKALNRELDDRIS